MTTDNYSAWDVTPLEGPICMVNTVSLYHLASWGILAASTHNAQPWRFQLDPRKNAIYVSVDDAYVLPESDPSGRQSFVSVGCALENILLAAESYDVSARVEYCQKLALHPVPAAEIQLTARSNASSKVGDLLEAMKKRTMNRSPYQQGKAVTSVLLDGIRKRASVLGVGVDLVSNDAERLAIALLQEKGDSAAIGNLAFRNELADYLLPNTWEGGRGMVGKNFGMTDEQAVGINELMRSSGDLPQEVMQGFSSAGKQAFIESPVILVISVKEETAANWIKAGQLLQYTAVHAAQLGVSIAVHAALTEMGTLPKALANVLGRKESPVVVARLGYAIGDPPPHSPRIPLQEILDVLP